MGSKLRMGVLGGLAAALFGWLCWLPTSAPDLDAPLAPAPAAPADPAAASPGAAAARPDPTPDRRSEARRERDPRVFGHVVDENDRPVVGATLQLRARDAGDDGPVLATTTSAEDGSFALDCADTWTQPYRIDADAPGHAPLSQEPIEPGHALRLRLGRLAWLFGRVLAQDTLTPLADAEVRASGHHVTTDAHGSYALLGLDRSGATYVQVCREGYRSEATVVQGADRDRTELDFALHPTTPLVVRVVDRTTRAPIAEARLRTAALDAHLARTDANGECILPVVEGQPLDVVVEGPGHCPLRWHWVVADADAGRIDLPLLGFATLRGRAVDEDGAPLAGVAVAPSDVGQPGGHRRRNVDELRALAVPGTAADQEPEHGARTDQRGEFELAVAPSPAGRHAVGWLAGHVRAHSEDVVLANAGDVATADLLLRRGAVVHGTALRNDRPVEGNVRARLAGGAEWSWLAWTDRDGRYEFDGVPPGDLELAVFARSSSTAEATANVTLRPGQRLQQDFRWTVRTGTIAGRVTSNRGRPLPKVGVYATPLDTNDPNARRSTSTRDDGTYSLEVDAERAHRIEASDGVTRSSHEAVTSGAGSVDFVLPELGRLRLRLLDAQSRVPVQPRRNLLPLAWRGPGDEVFRGVRARIDGTGLVEVRLPLGAVDLAVSALGAGYRRRHLVAVPIVDTPDPAPIDVLLERGVEQRIRLVGDAASVARRGHLLFLLQREQLDSLRGPFAAQGGPSNTRINGICMWLGDPGLMHQLLDLEDDGSATLRGLTPGAYWLRSYPDDLECSPDVLVVGDGGGAAEVRVRMR